MNYDTDPKVPLTSCPLSYIETWPKPGGSMREADGSLAE